MFGLVRSLSAPTTQLVNFVFFHADCGHMLPMDSIKLGPKTVLVATPQVVGASEQPPTTSTVSAAAADASVSAPPSAASAVRLCLCGEASAEDDATMARCCLTEWRLTAEGFLVWTSLAPETAHRLCPALPLAEYRPWAREALVAAVAIPAALSWLHTQVRRGVLRRSGCHMLRHCT